MSPVQPANVLEETELWLMRNVDGNNSAAFRQTIENVPTGSEQSMFIVANQYSKEHQTRWLVDFWVTQFRSVGLHVDAPITNHYYATAANSLEAFLNLIKSAIEEYNLPRCN